MKFNLFIYVLLILSLKSSFSVDDTRHKSLNSLITSNFLNGSLDYSKNTNTIDNKGNNKENKSKTKTNKYKIIKKSTTTKLENQNKEHRDLSLRTSETTTSDKSSTSSTSTTTSTFKKNKAKLHNVIRLSYIRNHTLAYRHGDINSLVMFIMGIFFIIVSILLIIHNEYIAIKFIQYLDILDNNEKSQEIMYAAKIDLDNNNNNKNKVYVIYGKLSNN